MVNTIRLRQYDSIYMEFTVASGTTVSPGHLLEITSDGQVKPHSTAAGNAIPLFAVENDLAGKDVSDSYSAGERALCYLFRPGDMIYAILKAGQTVSTGDFLCSAGDGTLQKYSDVTIDEGGTDTVSVPTKPIVAIAMEDKDLSGSADNDYIKVMIV